MIDELLDLRLAAADSSEVLAGACKILRDNGMPLDRASLHARQLHPQFLGRTLYWCPDTETVTEVPRAHGVQYSETYLNSPLAEIDQTGATVRQRLCALDAADCYPVLRELAEAGFTDYVMLPLTIAQNRPRIGLSLATRRPGGFTEEQAALMERSVPALATVFDLFEQKRTARLLLETYLGADSGRRVLEGTIRPGEGERIHAVVLSADLRGFTELSERHPLSTTIDVLNRYFDAAGAAIEAQGGQILKFIGDEILAIFPCHTGFGESCEAAQRALDAAEAIFERLDRVNAAMRAEGLPVVEAAAALHLGDMMYGNVGAANRLDFTAIGPAVNLVSRLQNLASQLGERIVVSPQVARAVRQPVRSLGRHGLKGLETPQEALAVDLAGMQDAEAPAA